MPIRNNYSIKGRFLKKKDSQYTTRDLAESVGGVAGLVFELKELKNDVIDTVDFKIEEIDQRFEEKYNQIVDTTAILEDTKTEAIELIKEIKQGEPGKDADEEAIYSRLEARIPVPLDVKQLEKDILSKIPKLDKKAFTKEILEAIPKNKASLKIIQEKFDVDPMSVIDKIMAMPDKIKLKTENIDGLEQTLSAFRNQLGRGYLHGGGASLLSQLNDVRITSPTNNQVLKYDAVLGKWINGTGGAGSVQSVTGLNTDNTDPANPIVRISVDGVTIIGDGTPGNPLEAVTGGGGTVTSFSFNDDNGFVGVVTNPTTTPELTLDISGLDATKIADGSVDNTEFQYLNGVTSSIQTQLNGKLTATLANTNIFVGNGSNVATAVAMSGDATLANTGALTLATVNANVGTFGSATQVAQVTVNAKGLVTAATNVTITPAASSITGGQALTKNDDTNVTLTLGGTPATALLAATSLTLGWTGTLSLARGGTGANLSDPGFDAVYVWDNTTNATRLAQLSGLSYNTATNTLTASGSGVSFGSATEIPYTNATGDDFDYTTGFEFDGTNLEVPGDVSVGDDLLLTSSGALININSGNWVATHTSGVLTVGTGDLRVTTAGTNAASVVTVSGTQTLSNKSLNGVTMIDATNIILDTTTGTKIGTSTSQKLGFFNATPIVQPTGSVITALQNLGLGASLTIPASTITSGAALTKVDDTNVTLTLGGTPASALLAATSLTLGWTGTLAVARGGTGAATLTGLLQGNGTSAVTAITNSSTVGQVLRVTGASTYAWGALDLADSDAITGVLPLANGGTGASLSDPGANTVYVWDDTTNATRLATLSGLSYNSGTNVLTASGGGGGLSKVEVTGNSQAFAVNTIYGMNNAGLVTGTLPTTAAFGDIVGVVGMGAGGWRIAQNASEMIHFGNQTTTTGTGGRLDSVQRRDVVFLMCTVADTEWTVTSSQGNITVT